MRTMVTTEDLTSLTKGISDAKIYVKNVFRYEIKMHSKIKVNCSMFEKENYHRKLN